MESATIAGMRAVSLVAGLLVAAASSAQDAASDTERFHVGAGAGVVWPDESARGADSGHGFQLLFGWQIARHWNLELSTSYFNFETGDNTMSDFYRSAAGLDAVWLPNRDRWSPYLVAGVGAAYNDVFPDRGDGFAFTANAGAGLRSRPLGPYGLRVRVEGRYVYDRRAGNPGDVHAFVAVQVPLRKRTGAVAVVETVEVIREVIREVPAPPPPPPALPPPDSDGDGVVDSRDRCPDTLKGTRVDQDGCAIEQAVVTLQGVHFETGSARLTQDSMSILMQAASALRGQPSMRIEVRGHTDAVGRDDYNLALSERRARSVVDFLVEHGIAADRFTATGFGETRPVADNGTPEGRASNRRVEFRVLAR